MRKIELWLTSVEKYLLADQAPRINIRLFRQSVYALLFLKIIFIWPAVPVFYQNIVENTNINWSNPINWLSKFLLLPFLANYHDLIMGVFLAITIFGVSVRHRLLAALIFIVSLNYGNLVFMALNGGDLMLGFFTFMLIFLNEKPKQTETAKMMNNAGWLLLKLNICFIYFINAYGKVMNKMWLDGSAMVQTWHLNYYVHPNLVPIWFSQPVVSMLTGWLVIVFEFGFTFLIWYRTPRKILLVIGVIFHVFIAVFLSLPDFGITMIIAYLLFADFRKIINKKSGSHP